MLEHEEELTVSGLKKQEAMKQMEILQETNSEEEDDPEKLARAKEIIEVLAR